VLGVTDKDASEESRIQQPIEVRRRSHFLSIRKREECQVGQLQVFDPDLLRWQSYKRLPFAVCSAPME
jgi:hypothetical protein